MGRPIFGSDTRIVARHKHELRSGANGVVIIAGGALQLCLADAALQIGGQIRERVLFFSRCRSHFAGAAGAAGKGGTTQENNHQSGGETQHGKPLKPLFFPPVCRPGVNKPLNMLRHMEKRLGRARTTLPLAGRPKTVAMGVLVNDR